MPRTCKICGSEYWIVVEYLHVCKGWSFSLLIEIFEHLIPSLNKYNLSNHFAKHVRERDRMFYEKVKKENVL